MAIEALRRRFEAQIAFARVYSPLYAAIWSAFEAWCGVEDDVVIAWLVVVSAERTPFDTALLLVAALHQQVLLTPAEIPLSRFYASVGGTFDPQTDTAELRDALRETVRLRGDALAAFIQTRTIQTNETARGIAWLLPLLLSGWEQAHLVDLGASAGLNLTAERRAFRLTDGRRQADFGLGEPVQFVSELPEMRQDWVRAAAQPLPEILSRTGCDLVPFVLVSAEDEATLASYVWADQTVRLTRLQEGIAALKAVQASPVPVQIHAVNLPDELPDFLHARVPADAHPVLIYSTYVTMYLPERGRVLREHVAAWARTQTRPVLWVQWEPPQHVGLDAEPPEFGWLAWVVDQWADGVDLGRDHLGWTHPHGANMMGV